MSPPAPEAESDYEDALIHSTATLKIEQKQPIKTEEVITLQPQMKAQENEEEKNMEALPLPPKYSDASDWAIGLALCCNILQECWLVCFTCATCQCECCGPCLDGTMDGLVECCNGCGECCIHCCN